MKASIQPVWQKIKQKFSWLAALGGLAAGIINGLLGAGGGMVVVPMLQRAGLEPKKAHATSVCVILPVCVFSSVLYLTSGRVTLGDAAPYLLWGAVGSIIGSFLLQKINDLWLRRCFALLIIWAAVRMLLR